MKFKYLTTLLLLGLLVSCVQIESKSGNYLSNVDIEANKLSCDGIIMSNYQGVINKSEFVFGESIVLNYENMTGFALKDSLAYPEMDIIIMNKKGDTVMSNPNLFKNDDRGFTEEDLKLRSELILAKPMLPNNEYDLKINIRDKNSDAYFKLRKNFSVINSPLVKTESNGFSYDIQYLYSNTRKISIVDNKINLNENIYLIIENLEGYTVDDYGQANIQASASLTDASGTVIDKNDDLFPNLISAADLKEQLYTSVQLTGTSLKNPITYVLTLKDNKSGNGMKTSFELVIEDLK